MVAVITLSPKSGPIDQVITITGTGFAVITAITITYNGSSIVTTPSSITTDGSGAFSATIVAPLSQDFGFFEVKADDGISSATKNFELERDPEYCSVDDVADWLRVDINKNTDPNIVMVKRYITMNEDEIDRLTGHTWRTDKQYRTDTFDVPDVYDYGRGLYIPVKHRLVKDWDADKGDKIEIWDGIKWRNQVVQVPTDTFIHFEPTKGILHIRGFIYTILRKSRFRVTYRYGGAKEGEQFPRDIRKCATLMTAIDLLSTDFKMSQIAYGGEGNIDKKSVMEKWQKEINKIIWSHSEILTVW